MLKNLDFRTAKADQSRSGDIIPMLQARSRDHALADAWYFDAC
jgi:hypothetical protein